MQCRSGSRHGNTSSHSFSRVSVVNGGTPLNGGKNGVCVSEARKMLDVGVNKDGGDLVIGNAGKEKWGFASDECYRRNNFFPRLDRNIFK